MKILVVGGGISDEREVSLRSSESILKAASEAGHETEFYDWDGSSAWLNEHANSFDIVFPILHGVGGEDGVIQKILEELRVPFLGSGSIASATCFDKQATLDILSKHGILVPAGRLVSFEQYSNDKLYDLPHVLKPLDSGSSIDTFIYRDPTKKRFTSHQRCV